jgi:hypothetical protein
VVTERGLMMSESMPEHHDAEDVAACLARTTQDGPGFEHEPLPASDFVGFPEPDVEVDLP